MENQKISLPPPSPTAYDDAFRTMLNDCSALIIPVVNLYFNETYTRWSDKLYCFYHQSTTV